MATYTTTILTDDLDASSNDVTSHQFALDDVRWEIDLSPHNLARLREALSLFMTAGRRLPAARSTTRRRTGGQATTKAVRRWWLEHRSRADLPDFRANGRIPQQVYQAYHDAR
jgi:hypothetical protein